MILIFFYFLGRFHAKSRLDGIVSVLWSLLLKATNKSGIKWFVCCMASKLQSADHLQSSKMASMAYYMLTKIEFAEYDRTKASRWSLFSYVSHVSKIITDRLELSCCGFSNISHFLERILMEHIDMRNSLDSKLQIYSLCSLELALEVEISSKNAGAYLQPLIFC